jgi:hypothetical protein
MGFGETVVDVAVSGGAGAIGFALAGPAGGALLGGAASGVLAYYRSGGDWKQAGVAFAGGAVGGLVGGAVGALGMKALGSRMLFQRLATPSAPMALYAGRLTGVPLNQISKKGLIYSGLGSHAGFSLARLTAPKVPSGHAPSGETPSGETPQVLPWRYVGEELFKSAKSTMPAAGLRMPYQDHPDFPKKYAWDRALEKFYIGGSSA